MDVTPLFTIALVVVIASSSAMRWHFARSAPILQDWADENGFEILEKSYRHFFKGPFFFRASRHQTVYRVTVRDKAGQVGTGWVACGSWWWGLWSNQAKRALGRGPHKQPPRACTTAGWTVESRPLPRQHRVRQTFSMMRARKGQP